VRVSVAAAALAFAAGCLEYSPHVTKLEGAERDLNHKAIARLAATPAPAVLRFAVVGDTQLALDEVEDAVAHLNRRTDLAFVVQVGDYTEFGQLFEFRLMNDVFAGLRVPWLVVIGNHDYLGNGEEIFVEMFGPRNQAFTFARTRFVLFDSNSREVAFSGDVPDLGFVAAQLEPDGDHDRAVLLSHVPPATSDFDPERVEGFDEILQTRAPVASFHGHEHGFRFEQREGVDLYVADWIVHRNYLVATLLPGGGVEVERVFF
jgi:3',5'-cyclic AMP phosphodiesterase CpdA